MVSKIRVLTDDTINKIAAGEVIENPSSVVKELVENSLDAGATEIIVDIRGGGRQQIRVTDNGSGMSRDDALLCLERHATSKLKEIHDLNAIGTMGFRGEAIPSIASISKFTLLTRYYETDFSEELGTMVIVDGGKLVDCTSVACAKGTTIEVKSLFFNVPVRKKFQKSPATDVAEIQKMLTLIAIGNPKIKFQLISNQETVLLALHSDAQKFSDILGERIKNVLGADYFSALQPIEAQGEGFSLKGYVGLPECSRHNRTGQFLFINRRGVQSPLVSFAIRDGYGTMLATGRHPIYVVHLDIEGDLLDVNVHPQKREVRLRQELALKELTIRAVEKALKQIRGDIYPSFSSCESLSPSSSTSGVLFSASQDCEKRPSFLSGTFKQEPFKPESFKPHVFNVEDEPIEPFSMSFNLDVEQELIPSIKALKQQQELFLHSPQEEKKLRLNVMGTFKKYILATSEENGRSCKDVLFYLVDQRLAHARITYEKLVSQVSFQDEFLQTLLIPHTLNLSPLESSFLKEHLNLLQSMGIHIKEFGTNTFVIDALPAIFGNVDVQKLIDELIDSLRQNLGEDLLLKERQKSIAQAASRSAVASEQRLSHVEAQSLLDQLGLCEMPMQCPSGRKTMILWSSEDITRLFS